MTTDKIKVLTTSAKPAFDVEEEFSQAIEEVVSEFYQKGMTARWQGGVLSAMGNDLLFGLNND